MDKSRLPERGKTRSDMFGMIKVTAALLKHVDAVGLWHREHPAASRLVLFSKGQSTLVIEADGDVFGCEAGVDLRAIEADGFVCMTESPDMIENWYREKCSLFHKLWSTASRSSGEEYVKDEWMRLERYLGV